MPESHHALLIPTFLQKEIAMDQQPHAKQLQLFLQITATIIMHFCELQLQTHGCGAVPKAVTMSLLQIAKSNCNNSARSQKATVMTSANHKTQSQ